MDLTLIDVGLAQFISLQICGVRFPTERPVITDFALLRSTWWSRKRAIEALQRDAYKYRKKLGRHFHLCNAVPSDKCDLLSFLSYHHSDYKVEGETTGECNLCLARDQVRQGAGSAADNQVGGLLAEVNIISELLREAPVVVFEDLHVSDNDDDDMLFDD